MKADVWIKEKFSLGESPFYDLRYDRYSWVDITKRKLHTINGKGEHSCFELGQPIGAAVPVDNSEGFLLAAKDGLYIYKKGRAELLYDLRDTYLPFLRSNDAKADPAGRLWFGSSLAGDGHEPQGALYCYDKGVVKCRQPDTKISNGMAWSSDRKHFYFSDSLYYGVFVYDYDIESGEITGRRKLFDIENGLPDGMCIDSDDNLWVAVWGGSRVERRCGRTGKKLDEIQVPAKHTTSCCFGGDDLKTMMITSSGEGLDGEFDGCVFRCETDVKGTAPDLVKI